MQTAKIKVNGCYAIYIGSELCQFVVTKIVTTKTGAGTESELVGRVLEREDLGEIRRDPEALRGDYTEHKELVDRRQKSDEEKRMRREAEARRIVEDTKTFYRFCGILVPKKLEDYSNLFRPGYGNVEIRGEGVVALLKRIRELEAENVPALKVVK